MTEFHALRHTTLTLALAVGEEPEGRASYPLLPDPQGQYAAIAGPAIDTMPRRNLGKLTLWGTICNPISADSHRPAYPAEIAVSSEKERTPV